MGRQRVPKWHKICSLEGGEYVRIMDEKVRIMDNPAKDPPLIKA
jgi:hypothetical protein